RTGHSPRIISPANKEIVLASTKTVPLRAKVDGDVQKIYWFTGTKFIGQAGPEEFLGWDADAGDYEITALDDHGRASSCSVIVR
ncbi:MAG: penicillin-binding protein 1C, partial [Verrucomicrobia bacterium]